MKFFLISLAIATIGCSSYKGDEKSIEKAILYNEQDDNIHESDFEKFYMNFRRSLLDMDTVALLHLTHFPLEVWGFEDNDPKITIDENIFISKIKESISYSVDYDEDKPITTLDIFEKNKSINLSSKEVEIQSIGMLNFKRIEGKWKLIMVYADTR